MRVRGCLKAYSAGGVKLTWSTTSAAINGVTSGFADKSRKQIGVEPEPDHRCRIERFLRGGGQAIDACTDRRLQVRRNVDVVDRGAEYIRAGLDRPALPFGQDRAPSPRQRRGFRRLGRPRGRRARRVTDLAPTSSVVNAVVCDVIQWPQRNGLRAWHPAQRTAILRTVGDQHQRRRLRDDRHEVGQHRLTRRVDPVGVLDNHHCRCPWARAAPLTSAVKRLRRASGPISGGAFSGSADPEQVVDEHRSWGSACGSLARTRARASSEAMPSIPVLSRINRATTWKGISVVWDPQ